MRPETAQGIFVNFKRLYEFNHRQLPLIVAQIGKSFRNEINPKSGLLRQREFLMTEIEHFLDPALKFKPYERFSKVKSLEVNLYSSSNQFNSESSSKMTLEAAVDKVQKENLFKKDHIVILLIQTRALSKVRRSRTILAE
jgi:glycyl-tRNA synthetase